MVRASELFARTASSLLFFFDLLPIESIFTGFFIFISSVVFSTITSLGWKPFLVWNRFVFRTAISRFTETALRDQIFLVARFSPKFQRIRLLGLSLLFNLVTCNLVINLGVLSFLRFFHNISVNIYFLDWLSVWCNYFFFYFLIPVVYCLNIVSYRENCCVANINIVNTAISQSFNKFRGIR